MSLPAGVLGVRRGPRVLAVLAALAATVQAEPTVSTEERDHWAFRPVARPMVPEVQDEAWCRNPIDRFVRAGLEGKGWSPAPPAAPPALLRRLTFDLLGLPPTPERREAFLKEPSAQAADRLVDELLARPEYGERWARHWLDVVRYAESNGYERDAAKPSAWRYRDYVIRAFNRDTPFDRFLVEQLAGDELPEADGETVVATTYFRLGPWDDEPADPTQDRFDQLDDLVRTTSEVFLGLSLGCARCHDHKFEPLTARDYYGMVAIFNGLTRPRNGRSEREQPAGSPAQVRAIAERDREIAAAGKRIGIRAVSRSLSRGVVAPASFGDDLRLIARLRAKTPDLPPAYVLSEPSPQAPPTHLLLRGQAATPGPEIAPGVPAVLTSRPLEFPAAGARTSLRRLTLARWLARPEHPLTARLIVNRVWQHHFGEGLVRTPSDFGTTGDPPTHPELLDWLADWFVGQGWSIKALHRLILTSNTYRMGTLGNPSYAAEDPEDRLLWHAPYRRLDAEAIRDAILAVSGQSHPAMYGPSMYPFIPPEALEGHSDPAQAWPPFHERDASRRTIYAFVKRSLPVPMLELLDSCDTARPTAQRSATSVAPQALTLFNGDFVNRQARHFADRLERDAGDDPARQVERAFLLALGRLPTETDRGAVQKFLHDETDRRAALEQVCRAIFNTNEFVYPD